MEIFLLGINFLLYDVKIVNLQCTFGLILHVLSPIIYA